MNLHAAPLPFGSLAGPLAHTLAHTLMFAGLGLLLGLLHFGALRWNTRLYLSSAPAWQGVLAQLLRLGVTVAALLAIARYGLVPLLLGFAGLLLARQLMIWRTRTTA